MLTLQEHREYGPWEDGTHTENCHRGGAAIESSHYGSTQWNWQGGASTECPLGQYLVGV